jgi:cohesin loading factor subunit SCC2
MEAILSVVINASDSTVVTLRTKALRGLGQIVANSPEILKNVRTYFAWVTDFLSCLKPKVRRAIEGHMLDNSPAVRDATIELIGKYIVNSPELASDYYEKVADRIAVSHVNLVV